MKLSRTLLLLSLVALLLSLSALAVSAQGTPTVTFKSPAANATVTGPDATITWDSSADVTIVAGKDAKQLTEIPTGDPAIIHTAAKEYKWVGVSAGKHTVSIVLGYSNHTPWQPRTVATISFTVVAPLPKSGAAQAAQASLVAGVLLSAAVLAFALGRKLRSAR
ncbi:MAG: hypothetical protein HY259_00120 [Chloroflexi bacterium]|nr:hypothetical protein [Chloroflexota bacterium]